MAKKKTRIEPRFWMVWNPAGRAPTMRHATRLAAQSEAGRLAEENPGRQFFVLKAVGGYETFSRRRVIEMVGEGHPDFQVPF